MGSTIDTAKRVDKLPESTAREEWLGGGEELYTRI
jgi:hypothetical protein